MSKYTTDEIQQIIDDLDSAQAFFSDLGAHDTRQIRRSLKNASDILTYLPDGAIDAIEKQRDVFEPLNRLLINKV